MVARHDFTGIPLKTENAAELAAEKVERNNPNPIVCRDGDCKEESSGNVETSSTTDSGSGATALLRSLGASVALLVLTSF